MQSIGTAQLNVSSNYCNRYTAIAMRGETTVPDSMLSLHGVDENNVRPSRATLVLPPNTPAFALNRNQDNHHHHHNNNNNDAAAAATAAAMTAPLAVLNITNINSNGELEPNILMASIVQSIDVVIGAGNPAAVGVRMRGAQGASLEDVAVFAAPDAFAGISGASGSGGAHSNLTVVGAQYGIDARDTQPSATLSNIRLHNQTCSAMIHQGLESLTVAGGYISVDGSSAAAGATAIISGGPGP